MPAKGLGNVVSVVWAPASQSREKKTASRVERQLLNNQTCCRPGVGSLILSPRCILLCSNSKLSVHQGPPYFGGPWTLISVSSDHNTPCGRDSPKVRLTSGFPPSLDPHQVIFKTPATFYSNRLSLSESLGNQSYSTKISFLHEDQSEFFINNIYKYALLSLSPMTFVPYWDTIWGCYPNPCSPNCNSKTLNNAFILFQFCLFSLLTSYCPRGRGFSLSPTKLSAY